MPTLNTFPRAESIGEGGATPDAQLLPSVTLTDAPRVVALKREFYDLDLREEQLKRWSARDANAHLELSEVRRRKAEIAREIFGRG